MLRWLKALPLALAVAALSIITAGCNPSSQAQVRFVHAIQDAGALDIEFNGTSEFTGISFTNLLPLSGYKAVPGGLDAVEGLSASTSTEVFSNQGVKLFAGTEYTVVATGFVTNTDNVVILASPDNNNEPKNGTVNFRVINASPSAPTAGVDIYILPAQDQGGCQPPATIAGLTYQNTSKYVNVHNPQGSGYTIYVCAAGSSASPIFSQALSVGGSNEGSIRTLILTDQPNVDELNPRFVILNDLN